MMLAITLVTLLQGSEELFSVEPLAPHGSGSGRRSVLLSSSRSGEMLRPLSARARPPPQIDMDEEMADSEWMLHFIFIQKRNFCQLSPSTRQLRYILSIKIKSIKQTIQLVARKNLLGVGRLPPMGAFISYKTSRSFNGASLEKQYLLQFICYIDQIGHHQIYLRRHCVIM